MVRTLTPRELHVGGERFDLAADERRWSGRALEPRFQGGSTALPPCGVAVFLRRSTTFPGLAAAVDAVIAGVSPKIGAGGDAPPTRGR